MDWDAGALAVRDFLHDAPEAFLTHATAADGATPATLLPDMPGCEDQPANAAGLRWAIMTTSPCNLALRRATACDG